MGFTPVDPAAWERAEYLACFGTTAVYMTVQVDITRLLEEVPFTVLCFKNRSALTQWGQVSGMTPTQQNLFYRFADWEVTK